MTEGTAQPGEGGSHEANDHEKQSTIPDDFYYDYSMFSETDVSGKNMEKDELSLFCSFGFDSHKRSNIHYVDEMTILSAVGNILVFLNSKTMEQAYFHALRPGAIGSLALFRVLRDGAVKGFSDLAFNTNGDKLASLGCDPDYMLTMWDWKNESVILRSKAFSQDVFKVAFAPENDGNLTTSGMGHIKFWRMAATFTGLKLQGYIGKFGASELTDISAFIQLADGKVLSSTETGNMLLWDGGMIKCELALKGKKPCHQGRIEVILLIEGEVFTGGEDGYVRIWDLESIDNADVTTASAGPASTDTTSIAAPVPPQSSTAPAQARVFELEALEEFLIGKDVKNLDSRGCTVAAGFSDGVLRIISHTPISLSGTIGDFTLHYVFKPHRQAITSISISQDGTYMATASVDKTVFFFKIDTLIESIQDSESDAPPPVIFSRKNISIKPIGFLELNSHAVSISFSPDNHLNINEIEPQEKPKDGDKRDSGDDGSDDGVEDIEGKRALLVTKEGEILSMIVPSLSAVETKSTFQLTASSLQLKSWILEVPPPKAAAEKKETESKDEVEEGGKRDEAKTEGKADGKKEEKDKKSRLTSALRRQRGLVITTPLSDLRLSASGKHLLVGSIDGMSCLRKIRLEDMLLYKWDLGHETYEHYSKVFEEELDLKKAQRDAITHFGQEEEVTAKPKDDEGLQWIGFAHDCDRGRVNSVATTFDDSFLCSAANDGGLFVWRIKKEPIRRSEALETDVDDAMEFDSVEDIVDSSVYTIQEEKLKAEKDRELNDAESKKQLTRDYVEELRAEFNRTMAELEKVLPEDLQEMKQKIQVDPDLQNDIDIESERKIRNVKKELEWISEKESIGPNKLKRKFFNDLGTEFIEIGAFRTKHHVSTFRTTKLEQTLESVLHPLVSGDKAQAKLGQTSGNKEQNSLQSKKNKLHAEQEEKKEDVSKRALKNDARSKLEARKALRLERSTLWKELMDAKPDESYEDPRDVAAIRFAELHMGDYKLKTGEKYIVPESERVDADKKKRQILMLKQSVYSIRESFNRRVLRLRQKKRDMVNHFAEQNDQIRRLSDRLRELGETSNDTLWCPEIERKAFPELRYVVKPEDIVALQQEEAESASRSKGGTDMGFASAPAAAAPAPVPTNPALPKDGSRSTSRPASSNTTTSKTAGNTSVAKVSVFDAANRSNLEIVETENLKKILKHQKELIIKNINDSAKQFDQDIENLSKERVALESDIKFADIKLLLLYREWMLLKEFEKHDNLLAEKLIMKRNEKSDIDSKIKECQEKLIAKKLEIEEVIQKEKSIQDDFHRTLGENNKHEEYLTKVFKKKIKRTKKKAKLDGTQEEGDSNEDEEISEEEDDDDYDDDDGSDGSNSVSNESDADGGEECPADCDPSIFSRVQELREKKLDQEDVLAEIQKVIESLKKENDGLIKKEKIIDMALRNTEAEIQDFQTQKQQKLNELDVVVPLRLHQVQFLEKNAIPQDLSQGLVFVNDGLMKLKNRIKELQQEKADIRKQHKELRKMHVSLIKSRKEKQQKLSELEMRATDVQMLKFGKIIDLEKLERMGVNKNADELREKLQKEDNKRSKEVEVFEARTNRLKEDLTNITRDNTNLLENIVKLTESQQGLEEALNSSQSSVTAEYSGLQKKDVLERDKLISLVQSQSMEIEELKKEIEILIQKPMRVLPVKNAALQ
ncbi:Cilia- and flagella-associated protein 44 [Dinochytrium kinnereticum]|nr:Cilia- and flagella-associated protein 44 [Dinochytrium kinnereticum]